MAHLDMIFKLKLTVLLASAELKTEVLTVLKCSRQNPIINLNTMKDLKNLFGAKTLSKEEQQVVKGGAGGHERCRYDSDCEADHYCDWHVCIPDRWGVPE